MKTRPIGTIALSRADQVMTARSKLGRRYEDLVVLSRIRNQFGRDHARTKLKILKQLKLVHVLSAVQIRGLHTSLCFIRAFPDSITHYRLACEHLAAFKHRIEALSDRERKRLRDSGIVGTSIHFHNSYPVVRWLTKNAPGEVSFDWKEMRTASDLDAVIEPLLDPIELDFFESQLISTRAWIDLAASGSKQTRLEWLMSQIELSGKTIAPEAIWAHLFDQADPAMIWSLTGTSFSKTHNTFPVSKIFPRAQGMRKSFGNAKAEISKPLRLIRRLPLSAGAQLIDRAMASLAVRHRETYHFNYANPREIYLADVGHGVNIFDEYRGSEAAFLWVQVMRVYHQLSACTRFIANPYQLGGNGNDEALGSGAFWFYYRLGYRPASQEIRKLATVEWRQSRSNRAYRTNRRTLKQLASVDMQLTLPGARRSELFEERWLETSSSLATRTLAKLGGADRSVSAERVLDALASEIGLRGAQKWSPTRRKAASGLASVVMALDPPSWPAEAKDAMKSLLTQKGGEREAPYASMLASQPHFLAKLQQACRAHEKELTTKKFS